MIPIEEIVSIRSAEQFESAALALFNYQARNCPPYRQYLGAIGCDVAAVRHSSQIPHLPIETFKHREVYCLEEAAEQVFTSSNTGGTVASHHHISKLHNYEVAFTRSFEKFYGALERWSIYGLLPNYLERSGSSLVYMAEKMIKMCGSGGLYLYDHEAMIRKMADDPKPKILLGVSYALLDLAEQYPQNFANTLIMETGGMKGHRPEQTKKELHSTLCQALGTQEIHSEYGMAELTSQCYSRGNGLFYPPEWVKISIRDVNDPFENMGVGTRGGLNIIDLANIDSCSFIETQDVGILFDDGGFRIEGRIAQSDIRGCNLLVQRD